MNRKKLNPTEAELRNSAHDWLHAMADEYGIKEDVIPKGWLTCQDIVKLKNITTAQAEGFIRRALHDGRLQKKKFRIKAGSAGIRGVLHYKAK